MWYGLGPRQTSFSERGHSMPGVKSADWRRAVQHGLLRVPAVIVHPAFKRILRHMNTREGDTRRSGGNVPSCMLRLELGSLQKKGTTYPDPLTAKAASIDPKVGSHCGTYIRSELLAGVHRPTMATPEYMISTRHFSSIVYISAAQRKA